PTRRSCTGWPKDVRPYQARYSVALEMGERGIDLGDVQGWLGHRHVNTTRRFYAPVLVSRLKAASETLAGRFGGWKPQFCRQRGHVHSLTWMMGAGSDSQVG